MNILNIAKDKYFDLGYIDKSVAPLLLLKLLSAKNGPIYVSRYINKYHIYYLIKLSY